MPENKPNIADIDGDRLVWGAKDIGAVINRDQRPTFYLLEAGRIEGARKIGSRWAASLRSLRKMVTGVASPQ